MGQIFNVVLRRSGSSGALSGAITRPSDKIPHEKSGEGGRGRTCEEAERESEGSAYARDGYCEIQLRGKRKHEDVEQVDLDGRPALDVGVLRRVGGVHVEEGVAGLSAVSLADDDKVPSKGKLDGAATFRDGRIDASLGLAQVDLLPRHLPPLQRDEALGQGEARIEGIVHAREGGADDVLDQLRVDDELVQLTTCGPTCEDVVGAQIGEDLDQEFVRKQEDGRGGGGGGEGGRR